MNRNIQYAFLQMPWLQEINYNPIFDTIPVRDIIAFLLSTPYYYGVELKKELALIDLEWLSDSNAERIRELDIIMELLLKMIDNTYVRSKLPMDNYIFVEWVDRDTVLLSSAKVIHDWI